ncbi:DUF6444 domain-containing protein [Candidatus Enterovibrio escicola]|uniref:DUF6444 domain-containing protein n=1 Tax=Candidatus Enterovibrio escicola TaxID=1927127 RepID=UPI00374234C9
MNYRTSFVSNENRLPASSRNSSGSPSSDTPAAKDAQKNLKRPVSEFKETDYIVCYQPDTCYTQYGGNFIPNTEFTHCH